VSKLAGEPEPGKAALEAFFTSKGSDVFAILPRWPGKKFLLKAVSGVKAVELLGFAGALKFRTAGSGVEIELPELPNTLLHQPAWVLKVTR
jgi:alpha-L-fucosidase